jgi:hypothetical protein
MNPWGAAAKKKVGQKMDPFSGPRVRPKTKVVAIFWPPFFAARGFLAVRSVSRITSGGGGLAVVEFLGSAIAEWEEAVEAQHGRNFLSASLRSTYWRVRQRASRPGCSKRIRLSSCNARPDSSMFITCGFGVRRRRSAGAASPIHFGERENPPSKCD